MLEINVEDYNLILLEDCGYNSILHAVLLHNEENVEAFQYAIYEAKEKHEEDIAKYGDDWEYISQELADFDYIDLDVYDTLDY